MPRGSHQRSRSRGPLGRIALATALTAFWLLSSPQALLAHPPYEYAMHVVPGADGRSLVLSKSFTDGIFVIDPVRLVVRDTDGSPVAQTDYGRDLVLLCGRRQECLVYLYDGLLPVLPEASWRLRDGVLEPARSPGLIALGVVAPLWRHLGGYLFATLTLAAPILLLCRLAGPRGAGRPDALAAVGVATVPYLAAWLYVLVLLSRLSLPLVLAVCLAAALLALAVGRLARRAGASAPAMARVGDAAAGVTASLGGMILALGILLLLVWLLVAPVFRP